MAGHGRPKDGVASLAYVPAIHVFHAGAAVETWMPGTRPGTTTSLGLMVRSRAKYGVSNHVAAPSFETALRASSG